MSDEAPSSAAARAKTTAGVPTAGGKLYIKTHGCQMNEYDSSRMADVLAASDGMELTDNVEEARDLTQETFLRAFQSIGHFRGESDLRTWIYRIAINQARNRWRWWRRRRRETTVSIDAPEIGGGRLGLVATLKSNAVRDPEQDALLSERERALKKALSSLKLVYREAVILRDIEGFAYEEIAAALSISVGTVKSRLARGRQELRRKLEGSL